MATTAPFSPMVCSPVSDGYLGWGHRQVWSTIDEDFGKLLVGFRHKLGVRILKNNIDKPGCSCRQGQTGSGKTFTMLSSWHGLAAKQSKTTVEEVATSMQNRTEILRICQNGPGLNSLLILLGLAFQFGLKRGACCYTVTHWNGTSFGFSGIFGTGFLEKFMNHQFMSIPVAFARVANVSHARNVRGLPEDWHRESPLHTGRAMGRPHCSYFVLPSICKTGYGKPQCHSNMRKSEVNRIWLLGKGWP